MEEEWRNVAGFEGRYQVSSLGRIKRLPMLRSIGNGRFARLPERISEGYVDTQGYRSTNLGRAKKITVHRLVCEAFHGSAPATKTQVAHWDGNKLNNRADNLRWADFLDNRQDDRRLGTLSKNERAWKARLTADDVRAIRREFAAYNGARGAMNQIANRRGLFRNHVRQIVTRQLWANIE